MEGLIMEGCYDHVSHEHRLKMLESQIEVEKAAIEVATKVLDVQQVKINELERKMDGADRRLTEIENQPTKMMQAWKYAVLATSVSFASSVLLLCLTGKGIA